MTSKSTGKIAERSAAGDENQASGPLRLELLPAQQKRAAHRGGVDDGAAIDHLAENKETSVLAFGDCRQGQPGKPCPIGSYRSRLQLEFLGAAQHLGHADRYIGEAVGDLRGIDGDAVKSQQ